VTLWNVTDPARLTQIAVLPAPGGVNQVNSVAFSPDGQLLASGSDSGTVILRNIADPATPVITATLHFTIAPPRFPGMAAGPDVALAFSSSGRTLTTIADNTTVTLWNVTRPGAASRITTITGNSIGAGEVAFSPGGRIVAGAPAAGDTLALWTLP
jgi:eukaryotic-like serine/threonine-protein kinase